jgi:peptidoglycan/xylan/chitin deacetylase (PgdA/CDA1 family)
MKRFLAALLLCCVPGLFAGKAERIPTCSVEVSVDCGTPEKAAGSSLSFLPLPEGKKVAFSCRWDDSTPSHLRTLALMKKYGYKGTFYLTDSGRREFWEKVFPYLHRDGFTVGNHTSGHLELPLLTPDRLHKEILLWNITLECRSQQPVTVLVIPYGKIRSPWIPGVPELIGRTVRSTGLIGGADISPVLYKHYGLKESEFFTPRLIAPGDKNPSFERFETQLRRHLASGAYPFITLGIHSLHTDAGLKELGRALKKYAGNPQWWYCNANEYSAYRFMALNSCVKGKKVKGSKAVFTVELPSPFFLGSNTPLWGACAGKIFPIPHTGKMPEKIVLAGKNGRVPGLPDLTVVLSSAADGKFLYTLRNSGEPLENVTLTLHLPPRFQQPFCRQQTDKIKGKQQFQWEIKRNASLPRSGQELVALSLDFTCKGRQIRVWSLLKPGAEKTVQDRRLYISMKNFSADQLRSLSAAREVLSKDFSAVKHLPGWRPDAWRIRVPQKSDMGKKITCVLEFENAGAVIPKGNFPKHLYFDGRKLNSSGSVLQCGTGKQRLVFTLPGQKRAADNYYFHLEQKNASSTVCDRNSY